MSRPTLPIPDVALRDCGAILGRRGAGKSNTGRVMLEHELELGHRCGVIDPKGDWWGLRLRPDGKRASSFKIIIFGGEHADIQIRDDMGKAIGAIVAGAADSFIIDLSSFSGAGQVRFMSAFAEAFFMGNRQPVTLFVDEADQLAPQRVTGEYATLLNRMEKLIRQGRQRGIFMWMLTQRPAVINKNLLSQAECLIAMKVTTPHDREALRGWMDAHDPEESSKAAAQLAKLEVGEAIAWVPTADFLQRVRFPRHKTFDSGRTPQHGETVGTVKLQKLDVANLAALLEEEGQQESELATLRREVTQARDELSASRAATTEARREVALLRNREERMIEILFDLQLRIGAAIGSAAIEALPLDKPFEQFTFAKDDGGILRPIPRVGPNRSLHSDATKRVRQTNRKAKP